MSENNLLKDINTVLKVLTHGWQHTRTIAGQINLTHSLSSVLLCAESLGFVQREIQDESSPVSDAQWRITTTGTRFIRFALEEMPLQSASAESTSTISVVLTLPRIVREEFELRNLDVVRTQDAFYSLFREAHDEVLIFSPYIDAGFAQMADTIDNQVRIRLVTTIDQQTGYRPAGALGRIAASHPDFELKYLYKKNEFGGQQTQIHAKLIISDKQIAYVGSANLTETSILHNLELGVLLHDQKIIKRLRTIFFDVFENFARSF